MSSHALRLVYDGLDASNHRMPTSLQKQITAGAQEFLGSHAYFLTEGKIPANVNDRSKYFCIHDLRQRDGSWEAIFAIDLANVATDFLQEYVRNLTKNSAADAAAATKLGFLWLIHRSYKAWKASKPLADTVFDRVEPVLSDVRGNGAPMYDAAAEAELTRRILRERVHSSMVKITAPIGRSAVHVEIWFDDQKLDHVRHRVFVSEEDIEAALRPIRERHYSNLDAQLAKRVQ